MLALSLSHFFFLWGLMPTARKGLLTLLGEQLTPMMQGPVGNTKTRVQFARAASDSIVRVGPLLPSILS
ncbi:MAG: hypothetical protein AUG82_08950 [Ktedonobacter sp. 13_1_20CM_4_53_11]|nr:MAG: hypothetical protein AUH05_09775 [Ktedonobacter sp. 13_2_20CM_53_11]OLB63883.1 MAG: hypothetical protein AUH94_02740 [Ktedonobacter sp. 13_2_20CM_2_54_8]OLE02311.1 MAG: hypothetical protein AUG82_08950 [Ktedonobacter sp. 13_1_20CM_4_53_11]